MVSVIIPTRNRADLLAEALASVAAQEPPGDAVEVIVVDDGSEDHTPDVAAGHPGARLIRTRQGSAPAARNVGIEQAGGEWIAFLDDDDAWAPDKLRRCFEALAAAPQARFLWSSAYICDQALRPGPVWHAPRLDGRSAYAALLDEIPALPSVVLHRDVFRSVGQFDVSVPRAEDRDLWLRAAAAGFECTSVPEPLVYCRMRERVDGELAYRSYLDTLIVLRRHLRAPANPRVSLGRRWALLRRVRGWYAHQMVAAARQAAAAGDGAAARRFDGLARTISPAHWARWRLAAARGAP